LGDAIQHWAHLDHNARARGLRMQPAGVVRRGGHGGVEGLADLPLVAVEGADAVEVVRAVAAHLAGHEPDVLGARPVVGGTIEFDALEQATGAVSHPDDADRHLPHTPRSRTWRKSPSRSGARPIYSTGTDL